jgi:hypothetical protein
MARFRVIGKYPALLSCAAALDAGVVGRLLQGGGAPPPFAPQLDTL